MEFADSRSGSQAVYFGTGDATTAPSPRTTDAILAVDIKTGRQLWSYQATENDVFMGGCNGPVKSEACPNPMGPDMDIGNSPILKTLPNGKRVLITGTKGADVFALDPDNNGALVYRVNSLASRPAAAAAAVARSCGAARQRTAAYYGPAARDSLRAACDWRTRLAVHSAWCSGGGRGNSLGAAPTAIPGVVFQGAIDGKLYAVSAADGTLLWEFNTAQTFDTVNKVPAHGGAIITSGAVVVGGMVFVGSGYAISSGASAGNVLLAFGVD